VYCLPNVCLYAYEFWLSLCKIVRSSVILLLPLLIIFINLHSLIPVQQYYMKKITH
jgi:hypothetical protein